MELTTSISNHQYGFFKKVERSNPNPPLMLYQSAYVGSCKNIKYSDYQSSHLFLNAYFMADIEVQSQAIKRLENNPGSPPAKIAKRVYSVILLIIITLEMQAAFFPWSGWI